MPVPPVELPLGYYRVLFIMGDHSGSSEETHYDLFYHLPGGWQFYQGLGEWVEMDEEHFADDINQKHRAYPESIDRKQALQMLEQIDREEH